MWSVRYLSLFFFLCLVEPYCFDTFFSNSGCGFIERDRVGGASDNCYNCANVFCAIGLPVKCNVLTIMHKGV